MRYSNQPALNKGDIVWYLSSKNVPHKPLNVTKSWTGPWVIESRVAQVLYRIKPYDTSSLYPAITVHVGRLKKFKIDTTRPFMPPDLRTDPDEELEEFDLPPEPEMGEPSPRPEREYRVPCQLRERRFVESPGGHPAMDGERMNRPARVRQPPRGSRIDRPPLRALPPALTGGGGRGPVHTRQAG
ncbi:MAG: hypothetical protein GY696_40575 [Gammaproteobacteria bacterium]|nr:hypothetical protein [Gammaproteobacteria bacterium]